MIVLIKVTGALSNKPIWIWSEHIVSMTMNSVGGAIVQTSNNQQLALKETPDKVFELINAAMEVKKKHEAAA